MGLGQPGLTGHREVIAGLDLERRRALSVQLGDEPRQTSAQLGMQTLDQNLLELVRRNIVSAAEARMRAANKEAFPGA